MPTPPSELYFDVKSDTSRDTRDYRMEIPGFSEPNAMSAQIVELRGWLTSTSKEIEGEDPIGTPEWFYDLELDLAWLDQHSVDPHLLIRVGNIFRFCEISGDPFAAVAHPRVHCELMGWTSGQIYNGRATPEPDGWGHEEIRLDGSPPRQIVSRWPWDPRKSSDRSDELIADNRPYVRIKGALINDDPHWRDIIVNGIGIPDWTDPKVAWGNHYRPGGDRNYKNDKLNPVRWTEIHPPDLVEILDSRRLHRETVRCVALFAYNGLLTRETRGLDLDIYGPDPKPSDSAVVTWVENVNSANTNFQTILEGNNGSNFNNTGAQITAASDHVHIHVTVKGELFGVPGKFNAIYRVSWDPHQLRLGIEPSPGTIIAGSQLLVKVFADEVGSQLPVAGRFTLDDEPQEYDTGAAGGVPHVFKAGNHFVRVIARDYPDARLSFFVPFRVLDVGLSQFPVELNISVDLTISVKDKTDGRPIYGATLKIINPGQMPTDPPQPDTYTTDSNGQVVLTGFIFRAKTHPRRGPENPFGKVSADNCDDKKFNLVETDLVEPELDLGEPVPPE